MDRCTPPQRAGRSDRNANGRGHTVCGHALLETPGGGAAAPHAPTMARGGYCEDLRSRNPGSGVQRAAHHKRGDKGPHPAGARLGARRRTAERDHGGSPYGRGARGGGCALGDPEGGLSERPPGARARPMGGRFPRPFRALVDAGPGSRRLRRGWRNEPGFGRLTLGAPLMEDRLTRLDQPPLLRCAVVPLAP
jgi:hypothetical protein